MKKPYNKIHFLEFVNRLSLFSAELSRFDQGKPILIKDHGVEIPIEQKQIQHISVSDNLSSFYCFDTKGSILKKYDLFKQLIEIEKILSSEYFQRIHEKYIVNIKYIVSLDRNGYYLKLLHNFNGKEIILQVSEKYKPALRSRYHK